MQSPSQYLSQLFTIRSTQTDFSLRSIGKTFFELLLKQISLFQMNMPKLYLRLKQNLFMSILKSVPYDKKSLIQSKQDLKARSQRFYQNLGCVFIDRNFEAINGIKLQLNSIISIYFLSSEQNNEFNENKGSIFDQDFQQNLSTTLIKQIKSQNKQNQRHPIQNINSKETQPQIGAKTMGLIHQLKMLNIKENDSVTMKMSLKQYSSQLQFKVFVLRQQKNAEISHNVDHYLRNVHNYRNQLNYFCLISKIPNALFNTYKLDPYTHVSMSQIKFKCKYLANSMVSFKGEASDRYLKSAENKAALMMLRNIYKQIPQLWKQFIQMKEKKQIMT